MMKKHFLVSVNGCSMFVTDNYSLAYTKLREYGLKYKGVIELKTI